MSYDLEKVKAGRKPLVMAGLVMDYCTLVEGVGACMSTATGDSKCYNTRATCNFTSAYDKGTKEYLFSEPRANLPKGVNMYPFITGSIDRAPTSTTGGQGLGKRGVVRVNFNDAPHHDRGIDKSVGDRTFKPETKGTFWGKFIRRNPYYEGRTLKLYYGYIADTFSFDDFEIEEYDIIDIDGPNNGKVSITAKDVLVRTYSRKSQYPAPGEGKLLAAITDIATSATLTPSGIGDLKYAASGYISIGKEAIAFTRSGDNLTFTGRGQWGTTAKAHKINDTVQPCASWDGTTNIIDMLQELLETGAGLPTAYIPYTDWQAERDLWMTDSNVKGILMKPESIEKVLGELSEVFMFDIWWDATAKEVRLKALSPEESGVSIPLLTEGSNIKKGSLKIKRKSDNRFTEVRVFYDKVDFSDKNERENFSKGQINADLSRSGSDRYNGDSIKEIYCRWYDSDATALALGGRLLARFSDTPEIVTFTLDQKDDSIISMAERCAINSWQFTDFNGDNETRNFQILEIDEGIDAGHEFKVKVFTSSFVGRYFFITPDSLPDYSASSDEQKEAYGYISKADGTFDDGTNGHKII